MMKLFTICLIIIYILGSISAVHNLIIYYNTGKIDSFFIYFYGSIFALELLITALKETNKLLEQQLNKQ